MKAFCGILVATCLSLASSGQIVISPKGDKITIDSSKWKYSGTSIYYKSTGNVGIGTISPGAKLVIDNGGSISLQALKLKYPFSGATTDSLLTWNSTDSSVRRISFGGLKIALSGLLAATASNTIDNLALAQTWNWSTASTQTPLTLTANSLTTGDLMKLSGTGTLTSGSLINATAAISASTTRGILDISNTAASTTGTVAKIQANSTANSGITVLANGSIGVGTATPTFTVAGNTGATAPTLGVDGSVKANNYVASFQTLTDTTTIIWDLSKGSNASVTLKAAGRILTMSNTRAGMTGYLLVKQDASGYRTITTMPSGSKVIGGAGGVPPLTPYANAVDMLFFIYDGTNYYWSVAQNFN